MKVGFPVKVGSPVNVGSSEAVADRRHIQIAIVALTLALAAGGRHGSGAAGLLLAGCIGAWLLAPLAGAAARRLGVTVLPGGRSIHARPTPLLGGIAVFVPLCAYLVATGGPLHVGLLVGAGLVFLVGAVDDVRGVTPGVKICAQIGAAFALLGSGFAAPAVTLAPLGELPLAGFEALFVVGWVVVVTNSINLIDGMDGLAATVALVAAFGCALAGFADGAALVAAGAALGFLRHNLSRARLFLGDAGSLLLGFLAAAFTLNGSGPVALAPALGLLALPLGDVFLSTARRWLRGKPIFAADRGHVHHLLLDLWSRPSRVLAFLGAFAVIQAGLVGVRPDVTGLAAVALCWAALVLFLMSRRRHRWQRILSHRSSFRRLHVVRRYAAGSLALAEAPADVRGVLDRIAVDLGLAGLRVRDLAVRRPAPADGVLVDERVECGSGTAAWSAPYTPENPVLFEEKRTVLCDLLRQADARLDALAPVVRHDPAPVPPRTMSFASGPRRPAVHLVARDRDGLARMTGLARAIRDRGSLDASIVYSGCRDDLGLSETQLDEHGLDAPAVELDVRDGDPVATMARVMERYSALVDLAAPAVVVVDDSRAGAACAIVARERGVPVARVGSAAEAGAHAPPADLVLGTDAGGARKAPASQLRLLEDEPDGAGDEAARLVPALESLLAAASAS